MAVDYSRLAADYDAVRADDVFDREYWLRSLVDVGHIRAGERLLDLGAGTGRFSRLLGETNRVVALDVSRDMLMRARAKGTFPIVLGDGHRLPFGRDAFDVTLAVMVLHHLRDFARAIREVARASKRIVVATTDMRSRGLGMLEEAFPSLLAIDRARFPRVEAIADAIEQAGFRQVEIQERPYTRMFTVPQQLDRVRRRYISTLDLLPPGEFDRGLRFLEEELPKRFARGYPVHVTFTFLGGSR